MSHGRCGRVRQISPAPGFDPRNDLISSNNIQDRNICHKLHGSSTDQKRVPGNYFMMTDYLES